MSKKKGNIANIRQRIKESNPTSEKVLNRIRQNNEDISDTLDSIVYKDHRRMDPYTFGIGDEDEVDVLIDDEDDGMMESYGSLESFGDLDNFDDEDDEQTILMKRMAGLDDEDDSIDDIEDGIDMDFVEESLGIYVEDEKENVPVLENMDSEMYDENDPYNFADFDDEDDDSIDAIAEEIFCDNDAEESLTLEEINNYFQEEE